MSLNRSQKRGSLIFTLTNNSGSDQLLEGFYFDGASRFAQSANIWNAGGDAVFTLTFTGGASSTGTGGGQETLIDNNRYHSRSRAFDIRIDRIGRLRPTGASPSIAS